MGNPIPTDGCNQYYLLSEQFQPGDIQNCLFDDGMIISTVKEQDQLVLNAFLIDSANNKILLWFIVENEVVKSIKEIKLKRLLLMCLNWVIVGKEKWMKFQA